MRLKFALLAAAVALGASAGAQAQQRALSDPVVGHPDPESLFTSRDRTLNRNKQAALHISANCSSATSGRARRRVADRQVHQHNPSPPRAWRAWSTISSTSPSSSRSSPARR
jgi:hypothetical protein